MIADILSDPRTAAFCSGGLLVGAIVHAVEGRWLAAFGSAAISLFCGVAATVGK